jgi:plastocyanin
MHIADSVGSFDNDVVGDLANGGQTVELTWTVPSARGTYRFRCDVHPVEMVGTITVE